MPFSLITNYPYLLLLVQKQSGLHPHDYTFTRLDNIRGETVPSIRYYQFSTESVCSLNRCYLLNTLSTSADIAGIEKMSQAIFARTGNLNQLLIHHSLGDTVGCFDLSVKYTSNSFQATTGMCTPNFQLMEVDSDGSVDAEVTSGKSKSN